MILISILHDEFALMRTFSRIFKDLQESIRTKGTVTCYKINFKKQTNKKTRTISKHTFFCRLLKLAARTSIVSSLIRTREQKVTTVIIFSSLCAQVTRFSEREIWKAVRKGLIVLFIAVWFSLKCCSDWANKPEFPWATNKFKKKNKKKLFDQPQKLFFVQR